jgi:geranylgeranylglycerol-phosphate geranylgeranyltransferase
VETIFPARRRWMRLGAVMSGMFRVTRPANSVVSGLAAVLGYLMATGTLVPGVVLIMATVILVTAAGNAINDYCDVEIDRINRPDRPIPAGLLTIRIALLFSIALFATGITISLFTNAICTLIAVVNSLVLVFYAARLKGIPAVGNLAISYLSGSIFLFGGALAGPEGISENLPIFLITFLAMMSRELLKDAEDIEGDKAAGAMTLPVRIGIPRTALIAYLCACIAVATSLILFDRWGLPYLVGIGAVDIIILIAALRPLRCMTPECVHGTFATTLLKGCFFASLAIFTVAAILL